MKQTLYIGNTQRVTNDGKDEYIVEFVGQLSKQQYDALNGSSQDAHTIEVEYEEK